MIPYGRHSLDKTDFEAVAAALRGERITQGPTVEAFEAAVAARVEARHVVAFSSGTSALYAAADALGLSPGDEVITTPNTFVATANAIVHAGARPVLADIDSETGSIDPAEVEARITPRTRAILAMDYAGHPCDYARLGALAAARGIPLLADACHAFGAEISPGGVRTPVGSGRLAAMSVFSFHPVKTMTTGEGGAVTTDDPDFAGRLRRFRDHGLARESGGWEHPEEAGGWYYEMQSLGGNHRITDFQCALGLSQLGKLDGFLARRRAIAERYARLLAGFPGLRLPAVRPGARPAWHLYVVRIDGGAQRRRLVFDRLRAAGIGVQVHYVPVHLHPYYRRLLGTARGSFPKAEAFYDACVSLPIFPGLTDEEQDRTADALRRALA